MSKVISLYIVIMYVYGYFETNVLKLDKTLNRKYQNLFKTLVSSMGNYVLKNFKADIVKSRIFIFKNKITHLYQIHSNANQKVQ